jgi:hypothetical protein
MPRTIRGGKSFDKLIGEAIQAGTVTASGTVTAGSLSTGSISNSSVSVTTTTTLDETYSGKLIYMDQSSSYTITLPPVADSDGFVYHFVTVDAGGFTITIAGASGESNVVTGTIVNAAGVSGAVTTGVNSLLFTPTAVPGDWGELRCNGTKWYLRSNCWVAGGINFPG